MNARKIATKLTPLVFYALIVVFLVIYLESIDWSKVRDISFVPIYVVLSLLLGLAANYWRTIAWFVILRSLGSRSLAGKRIQLAQVYAKSWMGRYIPGTAPWILGKIYFASKLGISKSKLAVSSLLEGGLQVAATIAASFVLLLTDKRLDTVSTDFKLLMVLSLIGCVIVMIPPIFNRLISLAYKILRRGEFAREHHATNSSIARGTFMYVVCTLVLGLSLFYIAKAVYPELGYDSALYVMGASSLAGAIGMLAIFTPSGLGVREGVLLVLLAAVMPKEIALVVAIAGRIISVVVDLLFLGLTKATLHFTGHSLDD